MNNKTVFLIRNVGPNKFGGGEIYQLRLAEQLKKSGFCPIIFTNSRQLIKDARKVGFKTLVPPYLRRQNWSGIWNLGLPFYFAYQLRLKKWYKSAIKKYQPEVVNIQSRDDLIAATLASKKMRIKILWTDHADFCNWVLNNVNVKCKNIIGKKIIRCSRYAEKVIFVSKNVEKKTRKMIRPLQIKNAIVIENGVVDEKEKYKNIKPRKNGFIYCGRVVKDKGVWELVAAFCVIEKKYKDVQLNIYGDADGKEIKELIGGNKRIKYHGATSEPLRALAENEIFVLPSYMEGLSLSLIEAAMMKKIIIATKVGGNTEIIEDGMTGLLVQSKNIEELAKAMEEVLTEPVKAKSFAKNVRKRYEEKFDFDKIFAEKMLSLYNDRKEKI